MKIEEAYQLAKNDFLKNTDRGLREINRRWKIAEVLDFGEEYGFIFSPIDGQIVVGNGYIMIHKETGNIRYFLPQMDFDYWNSAKTVPIEPDEFWL